MALLIMINHEFFSFKSGGGIYMNRVIPSKHKERFFWMDVLFLDS